jgi:hypothetical protein
VQQSTKLSQMKFWIVDKIKSCRGPVATLSSLPLPCDVLGTVNAFQGNIVDRNLITKSKRIGDILFICASIYRPTE